MKYVIEVVLTEGEIVIRTYMDSFSGPQTLVEERLPAYERDTALGRLVKLLAEILG